MVARNTQLRRKSLAVITNNTTVQMTISILKVDREIEGWVLILSNTDPLKEIH